MHVWEAGSPGACTPAGEWEAELSSWFVWGLSLLFGAASLVLAVVWASHLPAVLQRWRLKVARRKGSPWKETSDTIPTSTKIAVGLFAANIASVAYHATGFGIARALVCSWPPQALAVVETAHAMVTAGNFSVTALVMGAWLRSMTRRNPFRTAIPQWGSNLAYLIVWPVCIAVSFPLIITGADPTWMTPQRRMELSLMARVIPATMCGLIPAVVGLPLAAQLKAGQLSSTRSLGRRVYILCWFFIVTVTVCVPTYFGLLLSNALGTPGLWAAWACVEDVVYTLFSVQMLRLFHNRRKGSVAPSPGSPESVREMRKGISKRLESMAGKAMNAALPDTVQRQRSVSESDAALEAVKAGGGHWSQRARDIQAAMEDGGEGNSSSTTFQSPQASVASYRHLSDIMSFAGEAHHSEGSQEGGSSSSTLGQIPAPLQPSLPRAASQRVTYSTAGRRSPTSLRKVLSSPGGLVAAAAWSADSGRVLAHLDTVHTASSDDEDVEEGDLQQL